MLIMILTSHKYAGDTVVTEEWRRRHKDGGKINKYRFMGNMRQLRDRGGNRVKWSKTVKHWKRGWNEEMKVEAEPYETGAGRGRTLIMLALKRVTVLELCVLVRASSLGNEWLAFMTCHSYCLCAAPNHQASSQDQASFPQNEWGVWRYYKLQKLSFFTWWNGGNLPRI